MTFFLIVIISVLAFALMIYFGGSTDSAIELLDEPTDARGLDWSELCQSGGVIELLQRDAEARGWTSALRRGRLTITGQTPLGALDALLRHEPAQAVLSGGALLASLECAITFDEAAAPRWDALSLTAPMPKADAVRVFIGLFQLPQTGQLVTSGLPLTALRGGASPDVELALAACFGEVLCARMLGLARAPAHSLCFVIITPTRVSLRWAWVRQPLSPYPDHAAAADMLPRAVALIEAMHKALADPIDRALRLATSPSCGLSYREQTLRQLLSTHEAARARFIARIDSGDAARWQDVVLWYRIEPDAALDWLQGADDVHTEALCRALERAEAGDGRSALLTLLTSALGPTLLASPRLPISLARQVIGGLGPLAQRAWLAQAFSTSSPSPAMWELLGARIADEAWRADWWAALGEAGQTRTRDAAHERLRRELGDAHPDAALVATLLSTLVASNSPRAATWLTALTHTHTLDRASEAALQDALAQLPPPERAEATGGLSLVDPGAHDGALSLAAEAGALSPTSPDRGDAGDAGDDALG